MRRAARHRQGAKALGWLLNPDDDPFGSGMRGVPPWRAAEARLLARRVEELTKEGPYELSDVVLLLRATTPALRPLVCTLCSGGIAA